jgi:hypothetical protein
MFSSWLFDGDDEIVICDGKDTTDVIHFFKKDPKDTQSNHDRQTQTNGIHMLDSYSSVVPCRNDANSN